MTPPPGPTSGPVHSADPSDQALVEEYVNGSRAAFDQLVTRYQRRVYAICYRYFGNAADAEDATQDAFIALLRRASTFRGQSQFSTWMYRVTTNACNDLARKRSRRPQRTDADIADLPEAVSQTAQQHSVDDLLAMRELAVELKAALAELDPEFREPVVLHDIAGYPYADIAERLGVPVGTIKSRIHRGHARLALQLGHLRGNVDAPRRSEATGDREPSQAQRPPTSTR